MQNTSLHFALTLISAVLSASLLWIFTRPPEPVPFHAPQWEYQIETIPDEGFTPAINRQGALGWELVFARRASNGAEYSPTFSYELIFKRPLPPPLPTAQD